jgi:predicted metalloprotease
MRWMGRQGSGNVEDRRGSGGNFIVGGGIGGVVLLILSLLFGNDFIGSDQTETTSVQDGQSENAASTTADEPRQFVSVVLKDTEDVWGEIFANAGSSYRAPNLVLFTRATRSGCGFASSATGPFYCPEDSKVYIDLSFYNELQRRFGATGDFAMAYVIAHEVGHHVQHLMGITDKVDRARRDMSEKQANALSVKLELQADFFAGVWAKYEQKHNLLDPGDVDEALNAASAIGDDRLQKMSQGYVVPDAFTHGTSQQRVYWFKKGYETGDFKQGDTFNSRE